MPHPTRLIVASYNVHSCVGGDRRLDPGRIASVIRALDADMVALQEVDAQHRVGGWLDQWKYLADACGYACIAGISLRTHRKTFGNALLTRSPAVAVRLHDLSVEGREPRGAIDAEFDIDGRRLRVIATHFGLRWSERRRQSKLLVDIIGPCSARDDAQNAGTLLLGDLNEWRPRSSSIACLLRRFDPAPTLRTFPASRPLLPLDRILAEGAAKLNDVATLASPLTRLASDHLPLRAVVEFEEER
jgi:endonuclease/exonuclease/phosphatase family metal-dependent hydrolase